MPAAVLGRPEEAQKRTLCVDHDHETGRVRGLLCNRCNVALARFGDTIAGVRAALNYLERAC